MSHMVDGEDLAIFCPNCHQEHEAKFESLFQGSLHYIQGFCVHCNYKIHSKAEHLGMGIFHMEKEEVPDKIKNCFKKTATMKLFEDII